MATRFFFHHIFRRLWSPGLWRLINRQLPPVRGRAFQMLWGKAIFVETSASPDNRRHSHGQGTPNSARTRKSIRRIPRNHAMARIRNDTSSLTHQIPANTAPPVPIAACSRVPLDIGGAGISLVHCRSNGAVL